MKNSLMAPPAQRRVTTMHIESRKSICTILLGTLLSISAIQRAESQAPLPPPDQAAEPQNPVETPAEKEKKKKDKKKQQQEEAQQQAQRENQRQQQVDAEQKRKQQTPEERQQEQLRQQQQ